MPHRPAAVTEARCLKASRATRPEVCFLCLASTDHHRAPHSRSICLLSVFTCVDLCIRVGHYDLAISYVVPRQVTCPTVHVPVDARLLPLIASFTTGKLTFFEKSHASHVNHLPLNDFLLQSSLASMSILKRATLKSESTKGTAFKHYLYVCA